MWRLIVLSYSCAATGLDREAGKRLVIPYYSLISYGDRIHPLRVNTCGCASRSMWKWVIAAILWALASLFNPLVSCVSWMHASLLSPDLTQRILFLRRRKLATLCSFEGGKELATLLFFLVALTLWVWSIFLWHHLSSALLSLSYPQFSNQTRETWPRVKHRLRWLIGLVIFSLCTQGLFPVTWCFS